MFCQHLNELTLENLISKANYPVFCCEECIQVGDSRTERLRQRWVYLRNLPDLRQDAVLRLL